MINLIGEDGSTIIARIVSVIALVPETLNNVLTDLEQDIIFHGQSGMSPQLVLNQSGQRPPLRFGGTKVLFQVKEGSLFGKCVDPIGFDKGERAGLFPDFRTRELSRNYMDFGEETRGANAKTDRKTRSTHQKNCQLAFRYSSGPALKFH